MTGPKSETNRSGNCFGEREYETKIQDRNGDVYSGRGTTSEESQKVASDKYDKGTPSWKPGWL